MALRRARRSRLPKHCTRGPGCSTEEGDAKPWSSTRNENVIHPLSFLSLIRVQLRDSSPSKLRHKICSFLRRGYKRVEISSVPFGDRAIWLDVVRFLQIKQPPFVFRRKRFVTPVTRRSFATKLESKE